jgi:RecB family exonuclease
MLLTEQRFPRLAGQEPLDERTRRSYERVLEITFERVGENVGTREAPRYMATLDDLVAGVNVERPLSVERIRHLLTSGQYPQFEADPDVADLYYYTPRR